MAEGVDAAPNTVSTHWLGSNPSGADLDTVETPRMINNSSNPKDGTPTPPLYSESLPYFTGADIQRSAILAAILFAFWLILSGRFDIGHVTAGLFCACLITFLTTGWLRQPPRIFRCTARRRRHFVGKLFSLPPLASCADRAG